MKRREVIKNLSVLPAAGVVIGSVLPFESAFSSDDIPPAAKRDILRERCSSERSSTCHNNWPWHESKQGYSFPG